MNDENHPESGNVIFFILMGIFLIALVTAALRYSSSGADNIDRETLVVNASRVRQYAQELERAAVMILSNGVSEVDIRFAHPDAPSDYGDIDTNPARQVFNPQGGGAEYRQPPGGVNDGSVWEFTGQSHLPEVGGANADLIAVLPNVTQEFCDAINEMNNIDTIPADTGVAPADCVYGGTAARFDDSTQYLAVPNTTNEASFTVKPAMEACVSCSAGGLHFYHVLHAR